MAVLVFTCLYVIHFCTLLLLLRGELCTYYAGNLFIYIVRFLWELMGQVRGWAPLKAGFNPPVVSTTDRAKAVFPSFPSFLFVYDIVCLLYVLHVTAFHIMFFLLSISLNLLHRWVLSFVYAVSPA